MPGKCPNGGSSGCPEGTPCKFAVVCERVGFWVPSQMEKHGQFKLTLKSQLPDELREKLIRYGFEAISDKEFVLYPATAEEQKDFDGKCPYQD